MKASYLLNALYYNANIFLLHYIVMQILFAKCIENQHFLISVLPTVTGLLIWLEGKMTPAAYC